MLIFSLILVAALVAGDQLIKAYVVRNFAECRGAIRNYFTFKIGDFKVFSLTHIRNSGAGWSILEGRTVFLTVFTAIVIVAIAVYIVVRRKKMGSLELISLLLIIAGGAGNLIDRVRMLIEGTDSFAGVIDYIKLDFISFPVFNFADCCVTFGALLFCLTVIIDEIKQSKLKKAQAAAAKTETEVSEGSVNSESPEN